MSLDSSHFANRYSTVPTASSSFVVAWKYRLFVDERVLDAILQVSASRSAWRWQRCLLHLLSSASRRTFLNHVHVLLPLQRVLVLVHLQNGLSL